MINYSEEFASAYNELQKAIKDRSHLMQKVITDKNGHTRKVWVKTEEKKNVKTVGKIDDSSLNDEIHETYKDVLEWLNPYDRTDPDETTKYREAFESLSKKYSKERVAQDYKSMKSKMNDKESFSKLINSIPDIRNDRSYTYQILYNAIKNTKKENLDHILDKIENTDGSIDKQKLVDVLFPPKTPKKESASKTEIDKLILSASGKDAIKNAVKKYITDNPTKKDSIIDYISKKHDEVLSKYRDVSMYFRYAKTKEEKEKYTKELNKYDKLVDMYGYAHYYDQ